MTPSSAKELALGPGAEFDRIREIARVLGARAAGLGDDCALLRWGKGYLALSTDVSVEGVHFRTEWIGPEEIGWRAAAGALSDLAAEAAEPLGVLCAVVVPPGGESSLSSLMSGVGEAARFAGALVLGGDLSSGTGWSVTVTVLGRAAKPVTRNGARPGDRLWVTGTLGAARAALEAWRRGERPAPGARTRFARPEPRVAAGLWLGQNDARAMLDLSDGLGSDAGHLAAASAVALEIDLDAIPVAPEVLEEARRAGVSAARFAAEAGEDYELLVALPRDFDAAADFTRDCGLGLTPVGTVRKGSGVRFLQGNQELQVRGFDHFG